MSKISEIKAAYKKQVELGEKFIKAVHEFRVFENDLPKHREELMKDPEMVDLVNRSEVVEEELWKH